MAVPTHNNTPIGLRTFNDDFQKLQPAGEEADAKQPSPKTPEAEHLTAPKAPKAAEEDVHTTTYADLGVSLTDDDPSTTITSKIGADVARHTIDSDEVLSTDEVYTPKKQSSVSLEETVDEITAQTDDTDVEMKEADASIIRETREQNFRLFPAIIESFKSWFIHRAEEKEAIEAAKPTIINPEARKERLKEAARHSALPTSSGILVTNKEEAALDKEAAENEGLRIKERLPDVAATWSHTLTDEEVAKKRIATRKNEVAQEEQVTKSTAIENDRSEKSQKDTILDQEHVTKPTPVTVTEDDSGESLRTVETIATQEDLEVSSFPQQTTTDLPETRIETSVVQEERNTKASVPTPKESRTKFYIVIAGSVLIAILLGSSIAYGLFTFFAAPKIVTPSSVDSHIQADEQIPVSAVNPYTFLEEAYSITTQYPDQVVHMYPTITNNEGNFEVVSADSLLLPLNTSMRDSFRRSITHITFGVTRNNDQFIVLSVNDFDIAFSGMLSWEQAMATDLAPYLGEPTTEAFTDVSINNQDVRRSERLDGTMLLYSFVDKSTIVITTSADALSDVKTLLR